METKQVETITKKPFVIVKLKRVKEGLEVYCQSKDIEQLFKNIPGSKIGDFLVSHYSHWNAYRLYNWEGSHFGDFNWKLNLWGNKTPDYEGNFNFSIFRTVGLGKGITIVFPGVFSTEKIQKWGQQIKEGLKEFFLKYLKPIEIEIKISEMEG